MKVMVVGGGLAGLVAANKLARAGAEVELFESGTSLGGRAASDQMAGAWVNRGPHALYPGGGLRVLRELGVRPVSTAPRLGAFQLVRDGVPCVAPTTPWNAARANWLSWRERTEVGKFLVTALRDDPSGWEERPFRDLLERVDGYRGARQVVQWLGTLSTYAASDRVSAGTVLRQVRSSMRGVHYIAGGWQSLVDELASHARQLGVRLHAASPVKSLGALDADAVVLAVPPKTVERLSGRDLGARRPVRMASLDLVLRDEGEGTPRPTFDLDRGVYLAVFPGGVVHCAKYLDPFAESDADAVRTEIEQVLDLALPAWREQVEAQRYLAKIVVNHWFPDAATGGTRGRPSVVLDERTWVAGDWVGDAGFLADASILSGARAAELILHPMDAT